MTKRSVLLILCLTGLALGLAACRSQRKPPEPTAPAAPKIVVEKELVNAPTAEPTSGGEPLPNRALSGGQATVFNTTGNAFGMAAPGQERMDELHFFVGNSFFNQNWVTAPSSTAARDGLGPIFNSRSCAGCHFKDGRGRPPEFDGERSTGFLVRLSIPGESPHGAPKPDPNYGTQLQEEALLGIPAEGTIQIEYTETPGSFADGTPYTLAAPTYTINGLGYGDLHPESIFSPRVANQMIGLGLLEAIPDATLLALADPNDADGDGISGRPNQVWDLSNGREAIGRFGWKANQPHVLQQVASAFAGDMGITTSLLPNPNCTEIQAACQSAPNGGEPEISEDDFLKVVLYSSTLAVPARRNINDETVLAGEQIFADSGCVSCHMPQLETGTHPTIPAFSNQTIYPYTDLLLHDMGEGLADGRPDYLATGSEWRTPPLWGIGLIETVNGHTRFLHDGRARNLMEAVLWHGGEGESAKEKVLQLSAEERAALIAFLESL